MKKICLYCIIMGIFLLPGSAWSVGKQETGIVVPEDAIAVLHINLEQTLHTKTSLKLMEGYSMFFRNPYSKQKRNKRDSPEEMIDKELLNTFGFTLEQIQTITLFTISADMAANEEESGIQVACTPGTAQKAGEYMKRTYEPDVIGYKKKSYLGLVINFQTLYIHQAGDSLIFSTTQAVIEKMIDVLLGGPSIRDNKSLYKLMEKYKEESFYVVCSLTEAESASLPSPFDTGGEFGLAVSPGEDLTFDFTAWLQTPSDAEMFLSSVKGAVALFGMAAMAQDKKAYPVLQAVIKGLAYEQKGKQAVITGKFSAREIQNVIEQLPAIMRMMQ
jgi:hypothetical protein